MLPVKRTKKKRKLHPLVDDKVVAENNEQLSFISKEASNDIMTDAKRNAETSNLNGKKQLEREYANLLVKKRKKHSELNGNSIIKKGKEVDFESKGVKRRKKTDIESIEVNKSKKLNSESTGAKKRKRMVVESAEIQRSEMGNELADVPSNTTTGFDGRFDPSKLRTIHYQLSDIYQAKRSLFLKGDASDPLSLLILNIPPFISIESVKTILEHTIIDGTIKEVILRRSMIKGANPNETYRVASVRFESEEEVEVALRNCDNKKHIICLSNIGVDILPCGVTKYVREYRQAFIPADELQKRVDSFFEVHDAKILEEKQKAKKMHNVPDADGWITVTRSRFKPVPAAVVVKNKEDLLKLSKKKKRMKDNIPFYAFQLKQSKMKHLEELRQKFEEDKKKLALAKAARKFRPD